MTAKRTIDITIHNRENGETRQFTVTMRIMDDIVRALRRAKLPQYIQRAFDPR